MTLSSLIVQREIASIREIEEALARQVLYGGDLVTNLLEVSHVDEAALMPVVALSFGLPTAPPGELPQAPDEAVRLLTADVVAERAFAPLEVGASLVVAVAEPLAAEVEQELTFSLALPIEQRIAPLFRIRQALARDYGLPLEKRLARLLTKILHNGPRIASTYPPPRESAPNWRALPRPPSARPPPRIARVAEERTSTTVLDTFVRTMEVPPARPSRRRRGPLNAEVALLELEGAAERDVIFDLLFEFARQFFDYTALFIVHGDLAEGRDAFGDGASRDKVARIGVPLDPPSILSTARAEKTLFRAKPSKDGVDRVLMADLGRDGTTECAIFPIIVRSRVVALLLGDGGASGIDPSGVSQVELLVDSAAGAFERVIVRRKLRRVEVKERGAAGAKKKAANTVPPPPSDVGEPPPSSQPISSERPSVEELAPPIRELMREPMSRGAETLREPETRMLLGSDLAARSDASISTNHLASHPPTSGAALRAEGDLDAPPSQRTDRDVGTRPPSSTRARPSMLKRAEAPVLEFGRPSIPSVVTESSLEGGGVARSSTDGATSVEAAQSGSFDPVSVSPKAESPRLMRSAPVTDLSPQPTFLPWPGRTSATSASRASSDAARGTLEASSPPPFEVRTQPVTPRITLDEGDPSTAPHVDTTLVAGSPGLPVLESSVDENLTPIVPLVVVTPDQETPAASSTSDPDATPVAPPVSDADVPLKRTLVSAVDPVLALAQRKGAPPPVPAAASEPKPMPISEQQISVPPHRPPSSRSDHSRVLPSVIVDVSNEFVGLVDRVIAGPDEEAETALLRAGSYAMSAIMAKFPGPITIEPERLAFGQLPRVAECGPVIRLIASQRRTALPFVLSYVEGDDAEMRFWATYLLTELVYPDAIDAAVARNFDEDTRVRRAARAAVRALAEAHPQVVVDRLGEIAKGQSLERRIHAIEALGETREPLVVPVLMSLLNDEVEDAANAARTALVLITQQDFGRDVERWSSWWTANQSRHRLEWLIDSLMHDQRALRGSASEELRTITKEYFAYYDDLPKRERERAQSRYRDWWESTGRMRFSRSSLRGG